MEEDRAAIEALRRSGVPVIYGDATRPGILEHAGLETARLLVVATPDFYQGRRIVEIARGRNPDIHIVVRTHSTLAKAHFEKLGVGRAFMGEHELAIGMAHYALRSLGSSQEEADRAIEGVRRGMDAGGSSPLG